MQLLLTSMVFAFLTVANAQDSAMTRGQSGKRTDIPRWCGKPYKPGYPNYDPGGQLSPPPASPTPNLFLQVAPRHSIYDSSEHVAEFIVDTSLSYTHGSPLADPHGPINTVDIDIRVDNTNERLVFSTAAINSTGNLFSFSLSALSPCLEPYKIALYGRFGYQSYTATTELYYLPAKYNGSTVKIDNLNGGMLVANEQTDYTFEPFLPFGFYTSCSGYLNYSKSNISAYKDLGFNAINPVCAFTDGDLTEMFDALDDMNIWYQYDMRGSYLNLTQVAEQIPLIKNRSAFLSWYTADEPDGWQDDLNSTKLAYSLLKEQDPYHPTGLVLNCENYYFKEYSSGTDYIMEDAYPTGINATYSRPWNVTCNETYGDCGCDDCVGELQDVSNRLDTLYRYQEWLGEQEKPIWSVLQAFSDGGYWDRHPTTKETWAMTLLSFNHKAKAMMSWLFPASDALNEAHSAFAKVATAPPVSTFLLGAEPQTVQVQDNAFLDVSYWVVGDQAMVGVVNVDYADRKETISIELPFAASSVLSQPWGSISWNLGRPSNDTTTLSTQGLDGLATSIIILHTSVDDGYTIASSEQLWSQVLFS